MDGADGALSLASLGERLLHDGFVLTALELAQEACEAGRAGEVGALLAHFERVADELDESESESEGGAGVVSTRSAAAHGAGYVENPARSYAVEARISASLRQELTALIPCVDARHACRRGAATRLERRVVHALIQEHLLQHGLKLTAISLAQEVGEANLLSFIAFADFLGVQGVTREPTLTDLLRAYLLGNGNDASYPESLLNALEERTNELAKLRTEHASTVEQLSACTEEKAALKVRVDVLERERFELLADAQRLRDELSVAHTVVQTERERRKSETRTVFTQAHRAFPPLKVTSYTSADVLLSPRSKSLHRLLNLPRATNEPKAVFIVNDADEDKNESESKGGDKGEQIDVEGPSSHVGAASDGVRKGLPPRRLSVPVLPDEGDLLLDEGEVSAHVIECLASLEASTEGLVALLSRSLPRVTKGVILRKRDEILPLLLAAIRWNDDAAMRMELTQLLFTLIKVPSPAQRRLILTGCTWLATHSDTTRTATELLPPCWEHVDAEFEEQRLLVADSCGVLAPHVAPELRLSLLLSILAQQATDSSLSVRLAAARNFVRVLEAAPVCDSAQTYGKAESVALMLAGSTSPQVATFAQECVVPSFYTWCEDNGLFTTRFVTGLLAKLAATFSVPLTLGNERGMAVSKKTHATADEVPRVLELLEHSVPYFLDLAYAESRSDITVIADLERSSQSELYSINVASSFASRFPDIPLAAKTAHVDALLASGVATETVRFIAGTLVHAFIRLVQVVHADEACTVSLLRVLCSFCALFGQEFRRHYVEVPLQHALTEIESVDEALEERMALTTTLFSAIHLFEDSAELTRSLAALLAKIGLEEAHWRLEHHGAVGARSERVLVALSALGTPAAEEAVLLALQELAAHPAHRVRVLVVRLVAATENAAFSEHVAPRLLPLLTTLSGDLHRSVRVATVAAFGQLLQVSVDPAMQAEVQREFQRLIHASSRKTHREVVRVFGSIATLITRSLRDDFILPHLLRFAGQNNAVADLVKRRQMLVGLLRAFTVIANDVVGAHVRETLLVPGASLYGGIADTTGLEALLQAGDAIEPAEADQVRALIAELNARDDAAMADQQRLSMTTPIPLESGADDDEGDESDTLVLGRLSSSLSSTFTSFFK